MTGRLLALGWLAIAFFVGMPASLFLLIWFFGKERQAMRRLLYGVLVAVVLAGIFIALAQRRATAQTIDCQWFPWAIECWWAKADLDPTTVEWQHQQTFNPF